MFVSGAPPLASLVPTLRPHTRAWERGYPSIYLSRRRRRSHDKYSQRSSSVFPYCTMGRLGNEAGVVHWFSMHTQATSCHSQCTAPLALFPGLSLLTACSNQSPGVSYNVTHGDTTFTPILQCCLAIPLCYHSNHN